jgi:hypothetical protein
MRIATVGMHRTEDMVAENPAMLSAVLSQLRLKTGHGASWKTGAAYIRLVDGRLVVVPNRLRAAAVRRLGAFVESVR